MGKYKLANPEPLVTLQHNPYQEAFLDAVLLRKCPRCVAGDPETGILRPFTFSVAFERGHQAQHCPKCDMKGLRVFQRFIIRAGRRFGKTRIGTLATILEARIPNTYHWITAPTYPLLDEFSIPTFFAQIPQDWVDQGDWSESNRQLELPWGTKVKFVSLDDPERGRGSGLDTLCLDEAALLVLKAWEVIRPALTDRRGAAWAVTTPQGEDWLHERFFEPAEAGRPGYWECKATTLDNPIIAEEEVEEARSSMTPEMFAQEYLAELVTFTGAIYGDVFEKQTIDDGTPEGLKQLQQLIPEWPNIDPSRVGVVGLDPGADHPFGGCALVSTPLGMVVVDEYAERNKPAIVHKTNIHALRGAKNSRYAIDRSQLQMQIELAQPPFPIYTQPAENDIVAGIERVKVWCLTKRLWFVKSRTEGMRKEARSYRWKDNTNSRDGSLGTQQPVKVKDDRLDALRYALMLWPELPKAFVPTQVDLSLQKLAAMDERGRAEHARMQRVDAQEDAERHMVASGMGEFYS